MSKLMERAREYSSSPPVLFQFRQTATLQGGAYLFNLVRTQLTPNRPLNASATYFFNTITCSCDVAEEDYAGAIDVVPEFSLFVKQQSSGPFLRDPVQMGKYLDTMPYVYSQTPVGDPNYFTGAIAGRVLQTVELVGKQSLTIIVILAANELINAKQGKFT